MITDLIPVPALPRRDLELIVKSLQDSARQAHADPLGRADREWLAKQLVKLLDLRADESAHDSSTVEEAA